MKKIGELHGKSIVQGDPNLVNNSQILYQQDNNGIILKTRMGGGVN